MKKIKQLLYIFPEYYLLVIVILAGYIPPFYFNPFSIVIASIVILQIVFKNKVFGVILGSIFLILNLYMIGALISEFSEFKELNSGAKQFLIGGLSIWVVNMLASISIIYRYVVINDEKSSSRNVLV